MGPGDSANKTFGRNPYHLLTEAGARPEAPWLSWVTEAPCAPQAATLCSAVSQFYVGGTPAITSTRASPYKQLSALQTRMDDKQAKGGCSGE